VLIGVLYVVLALVVVVGFVGDVGPLDVPGLLIAALMIALALLGVRWSERRRERKRLVHAHGLSTYDARMAMHLVDSGQVMRGALRPAGRDYAQRQLDRGPTPVWVSALGVVMAVAVYLPYAALPGTRVFALVGIGFVGLRCHHTYTRPTRLRSVLGNLTSTTAPGLPTRSGPVRFIGTVVPHVPGPPLPPADTHGLLLRCRHHYGPIRNPLITALREGLTSEIVGPGRRPRVLDDQRDGVEDLYAQPPQRRRPASSHGRAHRRLLTDRRTTALSGGSCAVATHHSDSQPPQVRRLPLTELSPLLAAGCLGRVSRGYARSCNRSMTIWNWSARAVATTGLRLNVAPP